MRALLLGLLVLSACGEPDPPPSAAPDAGTPDAPAHDGASAPDAATPDAGASPDAAAPDAGPPCEGRPGSFAEQTLTVDGEARHYFLFVPSGYDCGRAWPVLVDFHGTAGPRPEEAYAHSALVDLAERSGFLMVRPRSRFSDEGGGPVYRWDQNPGDLARNERFVRALLSELGERYHLDPVRHYVSGFSSGTNMAARFLVGTPLFHGFAFVGGGFWDDPGPLTLASGARVYAITGFRDYLHSALRRLLEALDAAQHPQALRFVREADAGHELYAWHFAEIWRWLDEGQGGGDRPLAPGWSKDARFTGRESLLELAANGQGDLFATAEGGLVFRRASDGAWSEVARAVPTIAPPLTGLCFDGAGFGMALGEGNILRTLDDGATWSPRPRAPELLGPYFGFAFLTTVTCTRDQVTAMGYWAGVQSQDQGGRWSAAENDPFGVGVPAQVAAVRRAPTSSTTLAAGLVFVGRQEGSGPFTTVTPPQAPDWLNDVAAAPGGRWWVVGERGAIFGSLDDGRTFADHSLPGGEDLYAVDFWDESVGMAVGAHGYAILTEDGGLTWREVSPGVDSYLGDVLFTSAREAVVVGGEGLVLSFVR